MEPTRKQRVAPRLSVAQPRPLARATTRLALPTAAALQAALAALAALTTGAASGCGKAKPDLRADPSLASNTATSVSANPRASAISAQSAAPSAVSDVAASASVVAGASTSASEHVQTEPSGLAAALANGGTGPRIGKPLVPAGLLDERSPRCAGSGPGHRPDVPAIGGEPAAAPKPRLISTTVAVGDVVGSDAIVAKNQWRFRACANRAAREDPESGGTVKVEVKVGADGHTTRATGSGGTPSALASCIAGAFYSMHFDELDHDGGAFVATVVVTSGT